MIEHGTLRWVLRVAGIFNLGAALLFAFPESLGRLAGLPGGGPRFYVWLLAVWVALLGLVYLWLAQREAVDRPLLGTAALIKASVFVVAIASFVRGELTATALLPAGADLVFAALFVAGVRGAGRGRP